MTPAGVLRMPRVSSVCRSTYCSSFHYDRPQAWWPACSEWKVRIGPCLNFRPCAVVRRRWLSRSGMTRAVAILPSLRVVPFRSGVDRLPEFAGAGPVLTRTNEKLSRRADPRQPSARLQLSQPHARPRGRRNFGRPGGLRAGSPPSPPPRLIRPTVRRLLRSPRLSGPGPHPCWPLWLFRLWRQGRGHVGDRLKFRQKLRSMLHQVADDPGIPEQLSQIRFDHGQLQMVLAVGVLN